MSTAARAASRSAPAAAAASSRPKWRSNIPMRCASCTASFCDAGSQVLQALTFFGTREKLGRAGYGSQVEEINFAAVKLAKEVAGDQALVAGSVSRTQLVEREGTDSLGKARDHIAEQIRLLKDAGVDFLILETFFHLAEMKVALQAAAESGLPAVATMSFRPLVTQCSDGHTPAECARVMADLGAIAVGRELRAGSAADAAAVARNARCGEGADRRPAGRVPHDRRVPFVHAAAANFPTSLETIQIPRQCVRRIRRIGESEGIRLRRRLLRLQCGVHSRPWPGPRRS